MRQRNALGQDSALTDRVTLTPTEAKDMIVGMYKCGNHEMTPFLIGSPGCGKTSAARAAAVELRNTYPDFHYVEINPTMPADEVGGIPELIRKEGHATRTDYAMPSWFPRKEDNPDWRGIICLDDGKQGDKLMQQTLANLILARNLRGHALPEGAMIIGTGNRVEDKAGVTKTLSHLANRIFEVHVAVDPEAWINDFAIPNNLRPEIISYIMADKSKLDMFDPNAERPATSRSWERMSKHINYLDTLNGPNTAAVRNKFAQAVLAGEIGMGEATKFWAFCDRFGKMPDWQKLVADPDNADIDFPLDIQYAVAVTIGQNLNANNLGNALKYIDRIGPDLTTLAVKLGMKYNPQLKGSKDYNKWLVKNTDVVFN